MDQFLVSHGFLALFCLSFLASTLVPLGSEWLLVTLLMEGVDPVTAVMLATLGNTLGAWTTYWIGIWGAPLAVQSILRMNEQERLRAERIYERYGSWSLLFSWLPVVGDPLCLVGGILQVRVTRFLILVASGKLARYAVVSLVALKMVP